MDTATFTSWFHEQFVTKVSAYLRDKGLTSKALLLLDSAPSHPVSSLLQSSNGNIKCIYLPPNTTSLCQPMDQGVLENLKRRYKRLLLEKLLLSIESTTPQCFMKELTIKDCIYMVAKAWNDIRPESLMHAWNKLLMQNEVSQQETVSADSDIVESTLTIGGELSLSPDDIQTWIESDKDACTDFTDEEIIQLAQDEEQVDTIESDSEEDASTIRISHKEATEAFEICIKYLNRNLTLKHLNYCYYSNYIDLL